MKRYWLLILVAIALAGCPRQIELSLSANSATLDVGQSIAVSATSSSAKDTDFSWTVDNPAVASLDVESGGTVTITATAPGSARVTATGADSGATATVVIAVPTPVPDVEPEPEVSVAPVSAVLEAGRAIALTASSTDDADTDFTWTVSVPDIVVLSAETGLGVTVTALAPGAAWISATGSSSGRMGKAIISVPTAIPEQPDTTVTVTPVSATIETGNLLTLNAASTDPSDTDFSWTVSDASILSLNANDGDSVTLTALSAGVVTVTAAGASSGAAATATISVLARVGDYGAPLVSGGLAVDIEDVVIPGDRRPEVTFSVKNTRGDVVPRVEMTTAQFIIAYLDPAPTAGTSARYISYNNRTEAPAGVPPAEQATYDSAGLAGISSNGDGTLTYKFATALPDTYDPESTHVVGGQFRRTSALDGKVYVANATHEFRPDGNDVAHTRDLIATSSCNDCHTRLSFHGDIRRDMRLCILCHNPGSTDANTGNSVDMTIMAHKIHMGRDLPSVQAGEPYQLVGFQNSVHDYSTVIYPQDIRNCVSCHRQDGTASQADRYLTTPTRAACGSCHDRTWFGAHKAVPEGWAAHPVPQDNDGQCAICHTSADIQNRHLLLAEWSENPGLHLDITQISANPDDGTLAIDILATYGDGTPITSMVETPFAALNVGAVVAWPAWEYESYSTANIFGSANLANITSGTGEYTFTFANKLPTEPGLSFGIVMTGRIRFDVNGATYTQGLADNNLHFFTLDGSAPVARRPVVADNRCGDCHAEIRFHGEQRVGVDTCVMCHHSSATDAARRPAEAMPPETINFKDMIHRIHRGEDLANGYVAYGFGNVAHDYGHVRFPGRLEQCSICHAGNSMNLPLSPEALPTVAGDKAPVPPERAACVSCHDSLTANVHAMLAADAASGIESCAVCHGEGAAYAVRALHMLAP